MCGAVSDVSHMKPRCCLVMDQRVGGSDSMGARHWSLQADGAVNVFKKVCKSLSVELRD